ncbi:expressed unknown protein [Seminavis robusta]|uniref:Uncharacterized protein n=1 Tax=Seminavis robusta TaxID=568900 RepID=A0A9N8ENN3_9STRA|nr:expressed unknown protein [Seminavis robusta]|eukprot:Sro1326_g263010.1 n/a (322) ;mRNA; r:13073-14038
MHDNDENDAVGLLDWSSIVVRTPRRLESHDPDVVVRVGGIEFFHYRSILCARLDEYITQQEKHQTPDDVVGDHDDAQSNDHLDKNSKNNVVVILDFPDRDPKEWLEVYKFLDFGSSSLRFSSLLEKPLSSCIAASKNVDMLASWFELLGLKEHLKQCDYILHKQIKLQCMMQQDPPDYATVWVGNYKEKLQVLPRAALAVIDVVKLKFHQVTMVGKNLAQFQPYLLDDVCGEQVWHYFITHVVVNLPPKMVQELDKETIVQSPLFPYTVLKYKGSMSPAWVRRRSCTRLDTGYLPGAAFMDSIKERGTWFWIDGWLQYIEE